MERTARLGLPTLVAGQAGKEITHNEALVLIDLLIGGVVEAIGVDVPPQDPAVGRCWIVGASPVDAWTGRAGALACWTEGGWRFVAAREGVALSVRGTGVPVRHREGAWRTGEVVAERVVVAGDAVLGARRPAIAAPSGGTVVDGEARAALGAALDAMRAHGLIGS